MSPLEDVFIGRLRFFVVVWLFVLSFRAFFGHVQLHSRFLGDNGFGACRRFSNINYESSSESNLGLWLILVALISDDESLISEIVHQSRPCARATRNEVNTYAPELGNFRYLSNSIAYYYSCFFYQRSCSRSMAKMISLLHKGLVGTSAAVKVYFSFRRRKAL